MSTKHNTFLVSALRTNTDDVALGDRDNVKTKDMHQNLFVTFIVVSFCVNSDNSLKTKW